MSSRKESSDCYHDLKQIIQTGDIDAVRKYIQDNNLTHAHYKKCIDIDSGRESMNEKARLYPLIVAVRCENIDILNYLLSIGFSNKYGFLTSPMLEACKHGHIAVVKVLIELHGVDVNEIYLDESRQTAPSIYFHESTETALSTAASAGQLEIVQYLLEMGASVEPVEMQKHLTPLHAAVIGQDVRIVKLISQFIDVNITVWLECMPPLTLAASHANGEILTALLDAGADIEGVNPTMSPFCYAVYLGKLENAKILFSKGANPETRQRSSQCTTLEIAIQEGDYEMVRYLVVELNLPWEDRGLLDLARHPNHTRRPSVIKLLIDAGFSTRARIRGQRSFLDTMICELNVFLEETWSNPRTLKQMCCFEVRRLLGKNLSRVVDTIPLPRPLIDFVKLTHISLDTPHAEDVLILALQQNDV